MKTVEEIFLAAVEKAPADRAAYLNEACGTVAGLRAQVEALLRAHEQAGSVLEQPLFRARHTVDQPPAEGSDRVIGPYKLLEQIGEGGMGVVWMAQQTEPVRRVVALKVIKAGMDTRQVIARFEAERQALALMEHPNIARVLDGGTTAAGRPYFVMDLVKGVPITRYCDEHHLTPRQRLELFVPVCQAVQHAHQKGIIHRDLKPTNVLVAHYDGRPVPKVIDFGVAKAAGQSLTDKTLVTGFGAIVGTLEYMSPEQAEINQLDIDTRSDIYSLGVILYELLTGGPPFSRKEVEKAGMLEMLRVIREQEPPRPSTRLSTAQGLPALAADRGTEPAKLTKLVRGDLDWIVMKALEKERNRRYETANGLAMDVQRYLADDPVLACPPSVVYRIRKLVRRHKAIAAATTLLFLVLLLGSVTLWRELRQRDAAEAAVEAALERTERLQAEGHYEEAMGVLAAAEGHLAGGGLGVLRERVARSKRDLEMLTRLDRAYMQVTAAGKDTPWDTAGSVQLRSDAFAWYGLDITTMAPPEMAERIRVSAIRRQLIDALDDWAVGLYLAKPGPAALRVVADLADDDPWRRRLRDAAARQDRAALEALAKDAGTLSQPPANVSRLAAVLASTGSWEASEQLLRAAQRLHPAFFEFNKGLGWTLTQKTPPDQVDAARFNQAALALRPESPTTWWDLTSNLIAQGKITEATAACRRLVQLKPDSTHYYHRLGFCEQKQGNLAEAVSAYRRAIDLAPPDKPAVGSMNELAWILATAPDAKLRDPARAVQLAAKAAELRPSEGGLRGTLGTARYRAGDWKGAVVDLEKAIGLRPADDPTNAFEGFFVAMARWQLGEKDLARTWFDKSERWMEKGNQEDPELKRFRTEAAELLGSRRRTDRRDSPKAAFTG